MRGKKSRASVPSNQRISRISGKKAQEILRNYSELVAGSKPVLAELSHFGFARFLALLSDDILRLAVQPDVSGERMRARLMSDLAPALQGDTAGKYEVSTDDIAYCSNIVMPCLLLELGRRLGHVQIEFPVDPTNSTARFKLRTGTGSRVHSIENRELLLLASDCGPDLVGLCYFGDQQSRELIETKLEFAPQTPSAVASFPARNKQ
jgi:hypothetical protein